MRGLITYHLFINSIYSNIKYCFFTGKICCLIIIWEYNSYFYFISRMCTDQLLFKIINICTGTDYQICSFAICASTIKCNSVNLSYIINIVLVSICNFKRRICIIGSCFCNFRSCCSLSLLCSFRSSRCLCFFCCLCTLVFLLLQPLLSVQVLQLRLRICDYP